MQRQGLTLFAYMLRLCAAGARLGGSSPSASNHFWAPTPAGPTGGSSAERVTLEVLNRRIRTNADMLLDFKVRLGPCKCSWDAGCTCYGSTVIHDPGLQGRGPGLMIPHGLMLHVTASCGGFVAHYPTLHRSVPFPGLGCAGPCRRRRAPCGLAPRSRMPVATRAKAWSSSGTAAGPLLQQPTAAPAPPGPAAAMAEPPARRSRLPPPPNATTAAANRGTAARPTLQRWLQVQRPSVWQQRPPSTCR